MLIIQSLLQMTKSLNSNLDGTFEHLNTISYHNSGVCLILILFYVPPMNLHNWIIGVQKEIQPGGQGRSIQSNLVAEKSLDRAASKGKSLRVDKVKKG